MGKTYRVSRSFSKEEVSAFAHLTGDTGVHHMEADWQGRVMVHGLLTASLATRLGGDLNYVARTMNFDFRLPVYTGDTIDCVAEVISIEEREDRYRLELTFTFSNQNDETVLMGGSRGVIFRKEFRTREDKQ